LVTDPRAYLDSGPGFAAQVIDSDAKRDLAVLTLDAALPGDIQSLPLASQGPRPGDSVHQIGNPAASDGMWVYTSGTVRQVYRVQETFNDGLQRDYLRVETQSPTNPGDSGGPVVNDAGELVAVHHGAHTAGRLMTYGVDLSELKAFLEELRPWLAPKTAEQYNDRGAHYYERGRYERALADFTKACTLDPRLADAIGNRGWTLVELGDPKTALADFDRALQLNDHDPNYYQGRAQAHVAQEDYDRAVEDLTQAIRLAPDDAALYNDRADVYYAQDEYRRAIKDYDRAIKLAADEPDYYNSRGVCYAALEDYEQAIRDYTQAIERDDSAVYYHNRGLAQHEARKYREAAHDFLEVVRLDPDYAKQHAESFDRRELRIVNGTGQSLKVWIKYHTKTDDGQWDWFPGDSDGSRWAVYQFEPGEEAFLDHQGFRINADRIRLWAANQDETQVWSQFQKQDYVLAAEPYQAFAMDVFLLTIE
jgi:tetratricopeptide (TPR) repeat protein